MGGVRDEEAAVDLEVGESGVGDVCGWKKGCSVFVFAPGEGTLETWKGAKRMGDMEYILRTCPLCRDESVKAWMRRGKWRKDAR